MIPNGEDILGIESFVASYVKFQQRMVDLADTAKR
jgi:hypothetical protein